MDRVLLKHPTKEQLNKLKVEWDKLWTIVNDNRHLSLSEFLKILPTDYLDTEIINEKNGMKFSPAYKEPYLFHIYEHDSTDSKIFLSREAFIRNTHGNWIYCYIDS